MDAFTDQALSTRSVSLLSGGTIEFHTWKQFNQFPMRTKAMGIYKKAITFKQERIFTIPTFKYVT